MSKRPVIALLGAEGISLTGNVMALIAIPWFVLETTGSASRVGITGFFSVLPIVLASLFGGALVDRLGARRSSVLADVLSALSVALIPLLHWADVLNFPLLMGLVFLGGILDAPGVTARSALVPDAGERAGWTSERTTGAWGVVERASRLAGGPLAGVLIAVFGPANVLLFDALTFLISAALVRFAVDVEPAPVEAKEPTGYLSEVREGLRAVRAEPVILAIVITVALSNFVDSASLVAWPIYADRILGGAIGLGLMFGVMGGGSIIGALAYATWGHRAPRRALYLAGFAGVALKYPLLAGFPGLPGTLALFFMAGLSSGPLNPLIDTIKIEKVPPHLRGRVYGAIHSVAWMAMPIGFLVGGYLIDAIGLRVTLLVLGTMYLAVVGAMALNRGLRKMERVVPLAGEDAPRGERLDEPSGARQ